MILRKTTLFAMIGVGMIGCGITDEVDPANERTAVISSAIAGPGCADGTSEDVFSSGMVGCSGAVTWANRASLCAAGYRPAASNEWTALYGGVAPTHDYWTNDDLRYSGTGPGNCEANYVSGNDCGTTPMRVCTAAGTDAEGNACNWTHCGVETLTNQYLGGCAGNTTAGTLCVPSGCADGTIEQTFANGVIGCAGAVAWASRASLCGPGYRIATSQEWVTYRAGIVPTHDYWTNDNLAFNGSAAACFVDFAGAACPAGQPMRVCTPAGTDAEGNACNWRNCGYFANSPNAYFGGCSGNTTAGALCVPTGGCADGSVEQVFASLVVGCAGSVTQANAASLCAPGWIVAAATDWTVEHGSVAPLHDYWTSDALKFNGTGSNACFVSTTVGSSCPAGSPMRVCTAGGTDSEGNTCTWTNCGLDANAPDQFFGGCFGNNSAGTLCVFPVQ
ncbi:MAG TPA: hypothetical protein VF456_28595 [Vicinamibacterales bacterium]